MLVLVRAVDVPVLAVDVPVREFLGLDQLAVGVVELVGQRHDRVFRYLHLPKLFRRPSTSAAWPRGLTP